MATYESVFIARQDISSAQAEALTEQFAQIIGENGGTVSKKEYWGLKSLSFRIKKNRKGHYVLLNIEAPSAAVIEMERNMRISEDVIRYLTVKVEQLEEGPSAMMQGRDRDRGDRDRGDRDRDRPRYRDDDRPPRDDRPRDDRPARVEGAPE
ncbi:MAG: 30S ribosomal protein S6 [Pseudomonadota bacterium]